MFRCRQPVEPWKLIILGIANGCVATGAPAMPRQVRDPNVTTPKLRSLCATGEPAIPQMKRIQTTLVYCGSLTDAGLQTRC